MIRLAARSCTVIGHYKRGMAEQNCTIESAVKTLNSNERLLSGLWLAICMERCIRIYCVYYLYYSNDTLE